MTLQPSHPPQDTPHGRARDTTAPVFAALAMAFTLAGAAPYAMAQSVPEEAVQLSVSLEGEWRPPDVGIAMTVDGQRCPGRWSGPTGSGTYTVACTKPPPYVIRIGRTLPIVSYSSIRIVRPEELIVDLDAPLADGWPAEHYPQRLAHLPRVPLQAFLDAARVVPMFPNASQGSLVEHTCQTAVPASMETILNGSVQPLPAPCLVTAVPAPSEWSLRVGGKSFPKLTGCLNEDVNASLRCIRSAKEPPTILVWFGPGWQPVAISSDTVSAEEISARLRPEWPYDDSAVKPAGDWKNLRLVSVIYCDDAHQVSCCTTDSVPVDHSGTGGITLPSLSEAGCRTDRRLPAFAIVTFSMTNREGDVARFARYWSITSLAGRPYRLVPSALNALHPVRLLLDPSIPQQLAPTTMVTFFSSLKDCKEKGERNVPFASYPWDSPEITALRINLPAFALLTDSKQSISACAEAVLDDHGTRTAVFRLSGGVLHEGADGKRMPYPRR